MATDSLRRWPRQLRAQAGQLVRQANLQAAGSTSWAVLKHGNLAQRKPVGMVWHGLSKQSSGEQQSSSERKQQFDFLL